MFSLTPGVHWKRNPFLYEPNTEKEAAMSTEENKAAIQRLAEAMNAQDATAFDQLATPALVEELKGAMQWVYGVFEGHHIDITDMVAEGDKVWARVATEGGHSGEWEGIPPTGKQWKNTGVLFFEFADGKIAKFENLFDELGHLKQLGATITPPSSTRT
jgi:predicted ester cyclase